MIRHGLTHLVIGRSARCLDRPRRDPMPIPHARDSRWLQDLQSGLAERAAGNDKTENAIPDLV